MAKDGPGVSVALSGYLPGQETNGMGRVAEKLWRAFELARHDGDATRQTLRQVVVGVVYVPDAKVPAPGSDSDPQVNLKFEALEPVIEEDELRQVVELLTELRARRRGDAPTLFDDDGNPTETTTDSPTDPGRGDGQVPATGGDTTTTRRRGRPASATLTAVPDDAPAVPSPQFSEG